MNENAVLGNWSDDVRVEELVDLALGRRVDDVRRADAVDVAVLCEELSLELFIVGTRVVMWIGIIHGESRCARCRALHAFWRG